ncbi:MAG: hypothetical protein ACI9G1_001104 [Pirellulaceae bacterium]|jgi:hypothetical protein
MSNRFFAYAFAMLLCLNLVVVGQSAPPNASSFAITDPAQVDEDYAFQGEYIGDISDVSFGQRAAGLQVIARGDNAFEAVLLSGGLPGAGWDRNSRPQLTGEREGGTLNLVNDNYKIAVDGQVALVRDAAGVQVGTLRKINRISPTLGATAPGNATILFDGTSVENLEGGKIGDDGYLLVGSSTKDAVQDFRLHIEFRLPYMPYAKGQQRGNSGVYIQRRYEVQVLDSFGLEGVENECGGLYRQQRADVNMCFPPLRWQTYDIYFRAARFDAEGKKSENARITVFHNGVAIHYNRDIKTKTGAGRPEAPEPLQIHFQNHSNPVFFQNMWIIPGDHSAPVTETGCLPTNFASFASESASAGTSSNCVLRCDAAPACRTPRRANCCRR